MPVSIIRRLEGISRRVNGLVAVFGAVLIFAAMILVVADVSGRYLFDKPITGGIELEQIMLGYIEFLTLAYALAIGAHLRVTMVVDRLGPRTRLGADLLGALFGLTLFAFLTWGAWEHFWESWVVDEYMPSVVELPFWIPKFAMPVGMFLMSLQFLVSLIVRIAQSTES
jgi:TRAP-type C4-dicarboxylate transport system permease small subunit